LGGRWGIEEMNMTKDDYLLREELGRKIIEVSQICAEGYGNAISQFQTPDEQEANRKCAIAASNTGYFILEALGFDKEEIQHFKKAYQTISWP
jgi:hypothetical protein